MSRRMYYRPAYYSFYMHSCSQFINGTEWPGSNCQAQRHTMSPNITVMRTEAVSWNSSISVPLDSFLFVFETALLPRDEGGVKAVVAKQRQAGQMMARMARASSRCTVSAFEWLRRKRAIHRLAARCKNGTEHGEPLKYRVPPHSELGADIFGFFHWNKDAVSSNQIAAFPHDLTRREC